MCGYIRDAFDFDGDGKLNFVETAIAYTVLFGEEEEDSSSRSWSYDEDDGSDDSEEDY